MFGKVFFVALSMMLASSAEAASITRSYEATLRFSSGPAAVVKKFFTLTYDPTGPSFVDRAADAASSDTSLTGFNVPTVYTFNSYGSVDVIFIGGSPLGAATTNSSVPDFSISYFANDLGDAAFNTISFPANGRYTDGINSYTATSVSVAFAGATVVPEPAAWTMMLVGMSVIGLALRRRKKVVMHASYVG